MKITADLHIHGRYSRATSKQLTISNLEKYAVMKGVNLLGTSDFTHPEWIKELKNDLTEDDTGILRTKAGFPFILQTELSLIYSQDGKGRRVHQVVLAKNFDIVSQITDALLKRGRIDYDGRPIFKIPSYEFVEMMKGIDKSVEVIPAHIWTPWFSLFGSMSGFDRIEDCFKDQTKHIHALETGLSSDPPMNWRVSALDKYSLISCSDLHSFWPWRIGREATLFDLKKLTYDNLIKSLKTKVGLLGTLEFWPHEGKYHFDGHRACNVCMDPKDTMKHNGICPVCKKKMTIGVAYRVEELADREEGFRPKGAKDYKNLIPLSELISGMVHKAVATKAVWEEYNKLINAFGTELNILLDVKHEELIKVVDKKIADIIIKNREQKIMMQAGYDGVYGVPIFDESKKDTIKKTEKIEIPEKIKKIKSRKIKQTSLGEF